MYLGINLGETSFGKSLKDGASAVLSNSLKLRTISEERISRVKAIGGYFQSLKALLKEENLNPANVTSITETTCCDIINTENNKMLHELGLIAPSYPISHHYSHALTSFALSGFDKAIVVVWDCGGNLEFEGSIKYQEEWWKNRREQHTYYIVEKDHIEIIDRDFNEPFEMGFGEIYRSLTHLLGFNSYIHSSKAMALTAFGDASKFMSKELFYFIGEKMYSDLKYTRRDNYSL